jgi:hypothetical protein
MEGRSSTEDRDEEDSKEDVLSINTGISEVALPDTYHLQNIAATEAAKRKKDADKRSMWQLKRIQAKQKTLCLGNTAISYIKKMQHEDWKTQNEATEKAKREALDLKDSKAAKQRRFSSGTNKVHVAPAGSEDANHNPNNINNRQSGRRDNHQYFEKSTDDAVVGRFCKSQRRFNR